MVKLLVDLVTITRFTYISKNNNLLYLYTLMFGCDADEGTYPLSQKSYHQQGNNTSHFRLILIIKRHTVHQLAPAIVHGVLTEEVSCYLQNNDSSPHASEIFMTFWKFPELVLFRQFRDYRMDVYRLFCLQNVEVGIL